MDVFVVGPVLKKLNRDSPAGDVGLDVEFVVDVDVDVPVLVRESQVESRLRDGFSITVGDVGALATSSV